MSTYIKEISTQFPKIDTSQMIEVDRLMMHEYHIELIQMMENAGRCLAILTKERFFNGDIEDKQVVVLAGTGGNGGGALVAARRLHNWGAKVKVFVTSEKNKFGPIPQHQYRILERMGVSIASVNALSQLEEVDAILDGIIGYSLHANPYGNAATMIHWANDKQVPKIALDTPSGLDLTKGVVYEPTIRASATLTLAWPKIGLFTLQAKKVIGELYLGDISVPPSLYAEDKLKLEVPNVFRYSDIVKIF